MLSCGHTLIPCGIPGSFSTRSFSMAKPTPVFAPLLTKASSPEKCVARTNVFYLCKASLTQGSYPYPVSAKFFTNKSRSTLRSTVHQRALILCTNWQRYPFRLFCFRPLGGIPADHSLPARGGGGGGGGVKGTIVSNDVVYS